MSQPRPAVSFRGLVRRISITLVLLLVALPAQAEEPTLASSARVIPWGDGAELTASGDRLGLVSVLPGTLADTLRATGLQVVRIYGSGIYLARAEHPDTWRAALRLLPECQLARYLPSDRLDPWLDHVLSAGETPAFAVDDQGHWRLRVRLAVPALDEAPARALVAALGGTCPDPGLGYGGVLVAHVPLAAISALQAADCVVTLAFDEVPLAPHNRSAQIKHNVDELQNAPIGLDGSGVNLAMWDQGHLRSHCSYTGRFQNVQITSANSHATHVAGTMVSDASPGASNEGMAPGAFVYSYDYLNDIPGEMDSAASTFGIVGANNSFGVLIGWPDSGAGFGSPRSLFGSYSDSFSAFMDMVMEDHPELTLVFSAGNHRDDGPVGDKDGTPAPDGERYDIMGPLGCSKNVIAVGALDDDNVNPTNFSSFGPADDSRIKPELMANGDQLTSASSICSTTAMSGTSMAAPVVTGTIALLVQHYRSTHGGANPRSDQIRALLTNTTDELHLVGPDARTGFGRLDARAAFDIMQLDDDPGLEHMRTDTVADGGMVDIPFDVPEGTHELRQMLAWIDPPGSEFAPRALVNDLDLVLIEPVTGTMHYPYNLDAANPHLAATKAVNPNDNLEQVVVPDPVPGTWTLRVLGTDVTTPSQDFAIVSNVNLQAAPGFFLLGGSVLDCGVPQPGILMTLSGDLHHEVLTDSGGRYVFQLPAGNYTVTPSNVGSFFDPFNSMVNLTGDQLDVDFKHDTVAFPSPICTYFSPAMQAIPDNDPAGVTFLINVPDSFTTLDVQLNTFIQHPNRGDLRIELRAPGGSPAVVLRNPNPADTTMDFFGTFDTLFSSDEDMAALDGVGSMGDWEVFVADEAPGNTGSVFGLELALTCPTGKPEITTPSPLPNGTEGAFYSQNLMATSGVPPYSWSVVHGSLPPGLSLSMGGVLDGTPTVAGTYEFNVQLNDSMGDCDGRAYTLTIDPPGAGPTITTPSPLPNGTETMFYSQNLMATGGVPPYSWMVVMGSLPPGLSLSPTGVLDGTPTMAGMFQFDVEVTDSMGGTAVRSYDLTIDPIAGPPTITTPSPLPNGTQGLFYSDMMMATGGVPAYSWMVVMGALPPGLSLAAGGALDGTPTMAGVYMFDIEVTDSIGGTDVKSFSLTIDPPVPGPLTITTPSPLPDGTEAIFYSQTLMASGGTPPLFWVLTGGSLPPGLALSLGGVLDGTPTMAGVYMIDVEVSDSMGGFDVMSYDLTINPPGPPASGLCGDCDNNSMRNILDSLKAAQISIGLAVPLPGTENQCNVYGGASSPITVNDALQISRYIVGLTEIMCP